MFGSRQPAYYPSTVPQRLLIYACEFAGTAIMLFVGASAVALMWGAGSPVPVVEPPLLRRFLTGLLFAGGATAVVYSPLGQRSGAHINPAVTLAFSMLGKVAARDVVPYIVAQTPVHSRALPWQRCCSRS